MTGVDEETKKEIDNMSHAEMARLYRFSPAGHPYFRVGAVNNYFMKRFMSLGGITTEISKEIGWEK